MVAFMSWSGANYEDAIIISERLVEDSKFSTIHLEEFDVAVRDTKLGQSNDADIYVSDYAPHLDERIIACAEYDGDICVVTRSERSDQRATLRHV
jgi:DNA-directed RNA polymerase, beta subunit/140 kD subunit